MQVNKALLKELPPPLVALEYYRSGDLYMFDDFQTSKQSIPRRPDCKWVLSAPDCPHPLQGSRGGISTPHLTYSTE